MFKKVKRDMDVYEFVRLSNCTLFTQIKQIFYCCPTFHSQSRILINEHNIYLKMSVKRQLAK
jgi:hypothetical protein